MLFRVLSHQSCGLTAAHGRIWRKLSACSAITTSTTRHRTTVAYSPPEASRSTDFKIRKVHQDDEASPANDTAHSERFYDLYLNLQRGRKPFRNLGAWLTTLNATSIHQALPPELKDEPLSVLADLNADIKYVQLALEFFIVKGAGLPKTENRERYAQSQVGSRALKWLFDANLHHTVDFSLEPRFIRALMHCVVAEQESHFLFDWIKIEHVPEFARGMETTEGLQLRTSLLAQMIESIACWDGLDSAVEAFDRAIKWCKTLPPGPKPSLAWAGMYLLKRLSRLASPAVTARSQEKLIHSLAVWETDPKERAMSEAMLWLAHPAAPKAASALSIFQVMPVWRTTANTQ